ncbi:MAG: TIGR00266 family protein [Acidobacteria bacterium]|nr:TIGR00266 family protein [Acidobacteriota bacterium]
MRLELIHRPGNSAAKVLLGPGESFVAEGGAMIAMSGNVAIKTTTQQKSGGGLMKGLRRMMAGESFFLNHFSAGSNGGEVWVAATLAGDMLEYDLKGESLIVQGGSFVACEPSVTIDLGWQGMKTLLSGERMFWVHLKGTGKVLLSSFGAIYPVEVAGETIVDTGHIVAFQETLSFTPTKAGKSWMQSILGGEGIVCKFTGRGTVWCQSHNARGFGRLLGPMLKPR